MPDKNKMLDFILNEEVRQLLSQFAGVLKFQAVFFGSDGTLMEQGRSEGCCEYCRLVQNYVFGVPACIKTDRKKQEEARKSGKILCYRCHAGLHEIVAPVYAEEIPAGYLMFGQFRTTDQPPDGIRDHPMEQRLLKAFRKVPRIGENELENLTGLLQLLLNYIVTRELVRLPGDRRYTRIRQYIEKHLTETIHVKDLALHVGMSESWVTHFLRGKYGRTVNGLVTELRLKKAEELLHNTTLNISEIAGQCGFEDAHYFSRIFRKKRGVPPSEKRNS